MWGALLVTHTQQPFSTCFFPKTQALKGELINMKGMMNLEKFTVRVTISDKSHQMMLTLVDEHFHFCLGCRKWQANVSAVSTMRET